MDRIDTRLLSNGQIVETRFFPDGRLREEIHLISAGSKHNESGPAYRGWHKNGQLHEEVYHIHNKRHNPNGPAQRLWYTNGQLAAELYFVNNCRHRIEGPAVIYWTVTGERVAEYYYLNNEKYLLSEDWKKAVYELNFNQAIKDIL